MFLTKIALNNFKCYDTLCIDHIHPKMNVIIGNNATGKTSLLEAIRILIGSLYLKFDKYDDKLFVPGIDHSSVRQEYINNRSLELLLPCVVSAEAKVDVYAANGQVQTEPDIIAWERSLETQAGRTLYRNAKDMSTYSEHIQQAVREGHDYNIPLIAFFSIDRYKKERKDTDIKPSGSRLQGYFNALNTTTNIKFFLDLFYTETLDQLQNDHRSELLQVVSAALRACLNCKSVAYQIKLQELIVELEDHSPLPFSLLSDGVRSTLAMVMELAFRCYLLNPHLGVEALTETKGIVLIDEIDLHLHPSWQTHILKDLHRTFPNLQFIVTTHAPLVISQIDDCCIYSISDRQLFEFPNQNGRSIDYIVEQMGVNSAAPETKKKIATYFGLIEGNQGKSTEALKLRENLEQLLGKEHADLKRADMLLTFFV